MTSSGLPLPSDWSELEHYIARLARVMLRDPHAALYGRQGDAQHGLDVLATDRRPGGSGQRWAFQAKHFQEKKLRPSALEDMAKLLEGFPERKDLHTFIVVTTARVAAEVRDKASELEKRLGLGTFAVWDWNQFEAQMIHHCGSGPWLAESERSRLRGIYCERAGREFREAGLLHPLRLREDQGVRLQDVLIPPILTRAESDDIPSGATSGGRWTPSGLREGPLLAWLEPAAGKKPFLLAQAPMGGGKSVLVLHAVAELAAKAATSPAAPLPLRVSAAQIAQRRLDAVIADLPAEGLKPLWDDPMSVWVLFVDGLDEVAEAARPSVEQQLASLTGRENITAIVVTCRTSSLHPQMLSEATRLAVRPWNSTDEGRFAQSWEQAREPTHAAKVRPAAAIDGDLSLRENPLGRTLLAVYGASKNGRSSRARLFGKVTDGMFRVWAGIRTPHHWLQRQIAFENLALAMLKSGGRPVPDEALEAAVAGAVAPEAIGELLEIAERDLGLVQRVGGEEGWFFTYRAIAEYLAAGAVIRDANLSMRKLAEEPWAGEVVRLALDRQRARSPARVRNTIRRMLAKDASEDADTTLRRELVATRVARDLGDEAAPVAHAVAKRIVAAATDEVSAWRRRAIADEVSALAAQEGPLWIAVWRSLAPRLLADGSRAAWLATREIVDPAFWMDRIREQDISVRAAATERLARWMDQPNVFFSLVSQVYDQGYEGGLDGSPAVFAGIALRAAPRDQAFVFIRQLLRMVLRQGHQFCAGGAALALRPSEAPAPELLYALKQVTLAVRHPVITRAILDLARKPDGRAWLDEHWPDAPKDETVPADIRPPVMFTGDVEPLSYRARADVWHMVAPALQRIEVRTSFVSRRRELCAIEAACSIAHRAPEAALELLSSSEDLFFPFGAQEALGVAALEQPQIAVALVRRWHDRPATSPPASFPGVALDPLAARGDTDAIRTYAEWLPFNLAMMPLVPAYCPPSQAALTQPGVRLAAREIARRSWDEVAGKRLHLSALVSHLYGLWPAWEDDSVIREGLIAWAEEGDKEHFDVAVRAWLNGVYPPAVARAVVKRIVECVEGSRQVGPFHEDFPILLLAAERAGVLSELERRLVEIVEASEPSQFVLQIAAQLVVLRPERAVDWSTIAARAWPSPFPNLPRRGELDEALLIERAPRVWARACLDTLASQGPWLTLRFLGVARILWRLLRPSKLRRELLEAVRQLASNDSLWVSAERFGSSVRVANEARETLFAMGQRTK